MTDLRRPAPHLSWSARLREHLRRRQIASPGHDDTEAASAPLDVISFDEEPRSITYRLMMGAGVVVASLGVAWALLVWSQRSQIPIDDQLPYLADAAVAGEEPTAVVTPVPAGVSAQASVTVSPTLVPALPKIVVHVSGAVRRPGIVQMAAPLRVFEAIELAGGALATADLNRVNLAAPALDGQRVHIPHVGEEPIELPGQLGPSPAASSTSDSIGVLDINLATERELETLPGIGPALAEAITRLRLERGPFLVIDELIDVPGIGESKLARLRDYLVAGPDP